MRMGALLFLVLSSLQAETVERLAVAVGRQVITELQIDEELRTAAMLNAKSVERGLEERRTAADRLVEQLLIRLEMDISRYPLPDKTDIDQYLEQIRGRSASPAQFQKTLQDYNLTEATLREHLALQLMELRFIEYRFRTQEEVSDADVESAYRKQIATWKETHTDPPPTLAASREALRTMLVNERTDTALNNWLAETRKQYMIVYFDKALE